jgi:hypothetical protein
LIQDLAAKKMSEIAVAANAFQWLNKEKNEMRL